MGMEKKTTHKTNYFKQKYLAWLLSSDTFDIPSIPTKMHTSGAIKKESTTAD